MTWQARLADIMAHIRAGRTEQTWRYPIRHGSMRVGVYAPVGEDAQTPHDQDEVYIVQSGRGVFQRGGERAPFQAGDVLFVPARMEHRFEGFTPDFVTWVVFYGPKEGEAA